MSLKISKIGVFVLFLILLLYLSLLPTKPIGGYLDDIVPLVFFVFWIQYLVKNKKKSRERIIFLCLIIICILGMISNITSGIHRSISDIVLDMFSFLKMFFVYLGTKALFDNRQKTIGTAVSILATFSKLFLLVGFFFGILHHLGIVSLGEQERYGFRAYAFVFGNASQFGILTGVATCFVIFENSKSRKLFTILGMLTLIMTLKGMSFIIAGVYCSLYLLQTKKIKVWHLVIVGVVLAFLLRFQIYGYLLDSSAPRAVLLRYGIKTANRYFPLGAGFGTYGSDTAAKHYSPLYIQYGFATREVLTYGSHSTLNDVYLGMVFGQFGWIGASIAIVIFTLIGISIFKAKNPNSHSFRMVISLFACLCGMAIMAGSIKVAGGQLMLFCIQTFLCRNDCARTPLAIMSLLNQRG